MRPLVQLVDVGVLQGVLEAAAGDTRADIDVLRGLQEQIGALNFRQLRPQTIDDLRRIEFALVVRLERNEKSAGIRRLGAAGAAGLRCRRTRCLGP